MKKILTEKDIENAEDNSKICRMLIEIVEGQAKYKQDIENQMILEEQNVNHIPYID